MKEKFNLYLSRFLFFLIVVTLFNLFLINKSQAVFKEELIDKLKTTNTLSFDFTQKIGEKTQSGSCYIKYPLLMKCEYPKIKKSVISNGISVAIIKKRYKKIYYYPLKKTPLFYLLKKEHILKVIQDNKPIKIGKNNIQYKFKGDNSTKLKIFFNKDSLELSGWNTIDAYSNEVNFIISNVDRNILIENKIFKIPNEEDL